MEKFHSGEEYFGNMEDRLAEIDREILELERLKKEGEKIMDLRVLDLISDLRNDAKSLRRENTHDFEGTKGDMSLVIEAAYMLLESCTSEFRTYAEKILKEIETLLKNI